MPVLHLDGFDGPMDLLLELAERQRVDFGRMSVLDLADQFVAAMEHLVGRVPIERRADWLVLATRLVLLRSRLLFPASPEEAVEAEQEADAEVRRVEGLAFVRAAAAWLSARPQLGAATRHRRLRPARCESAFPGTWLCRAHRGLSGRAAGQGRAAGRGTGL
jgi:segregation and condensation protein A